MRHSLLIILVLSAAAAGWSQSTRAEPVQRRNREASAEVSAGVQLATDIAYRDGPGNAWRLDLAAPEEKGAAPRPAIVFIHGGGWRTGDKADRQWRALSLEYAAQGYVAISINYRLAREAPFPACVEDVKCAVRWLRANAGKYHVDPHRIGAYGNSAGAHLAAMLGLAGPEAKLEGDGPHQQESSLVQAVCCSATPADFSDWGEGSRQGTSAVAGLLAGPAESIAQRKARASPISHVHAQAPPFLVIHGTADETVPFRQGQKLAEALEKAGAKAVSFMPIEGGAHNAFAKNEQQTKPAMAEFFARALGAGAAARREPPDGPTGTEPGFNLKARGIGWHDAQPPGRTPDPATH